MKDGLYQYKHGRICAGFVVRGGGIDYEHSAPILRNIIRKYLAYPVFYRRTKWIGYETTEAGNGTSSSRSSSKRQ